MSHRRNRLLANSLAGVAVFMSAHRDTLRSEWHARFDNRKKVAPKEASKLLTVRAAATPDTTEILFYDEVGFWGITAEQFADTFNAVTTPKISLRINSPGGDVFDGYTIFNTIKASKKPVAVTVDGLAASAASFIAMAGDTLAMGDPSMLMIHRAFTFAMGNTNDMKAVTDLLAKVDGQIADVYANKSGKSAKAMVDLMDAETWLTAQEAADLGFVDEVLTDNEDTGAKAASESAHAARLRGAKLIELGIH